MANDVDAYLSATRRLRGDFVAHDHYQKIYDSICALMRGFGPLPEFVVTYSTTRDCEILELRGKKYIIYDQYLGQTFNQLNRLHINSEDPEEAVAYSFKVMAEFYQLKGKLYNSLICAVAHNELRDKSANTYLRDKNIRHRLATTSIQEIYVIVHELFHHIISENIEWKQHLLTDLRRDFLSQKRFELDETKKLLEIDKDDVRNKVINLLKQQKKLLSSDDALVEECVCDTLAVPVVWMIFQGIFDAGLVRSAIFFALRHLRLLAILRRYSSSNLENISEEINQEWIYPYLVRNSVLQWCVQNFQPLSSVASSRQDDEVFMHEQERYEYFVEDPVFEDVCSRLAKINLSKNLKIEGEKVNIINEVIDSYIDNSQINKAIRKIDERKFTLNLRNVTENSMSEFKNNLYNLIIDED